MFNSESGQFYIADTIAPHTLFLVIEFSGLGLARSSAKLTNEANGGGGGLARS
jgi:hypothetical protein